MAEGSSLRSRRARVLLAIVGVVAVAALLGGGVLIGTGGLGLLDNPTPPIYYITFPPGLAEATPDASPTSSDASPDVSPDASPTGSPGASSTAALTSRPPTPTPALANLKVGPPIWPIFFCGRADEVRVDITNDGPVATTRTAVLQLVDTYDGHEAHRTTGTIPILAPGGTHRSYFVITFNSGCGVEHVMTFRIDPSNVVPESWKLDNIRAVPHYVGRAGPNFRVTDIVVNPTQPECSVAFDVVVTVFNWGTLTGAASNLRVVDMAGQTELIPGKVVRVPAIAPLSRVDVTAHLTVQSHCLHELHTIKAVADYDRLIYETDEGDNTQYHYYYMGDD